jgi:hypothetical protein
VTNEEKLTFLYSKATGLASAIYIFLDAHQISENHTINLAELIDWVEHFEKAMVEYNEMPENQ